MVQFEELRLHLLEYEDKLKELGEALGLDEMKKTVAELEAKTAENGFWDDVANTQVVLNSFAQKQNSEIRKSQGIL